MNVLLCELTVAATWRPGGVSWSCH